MLYFWENKKEMEVSMQKDCVNVSDDFQQKCC